MTLPQPPKICRYCGAPILWGLKPDGKQGWHRPLDAMSGKPSYMVFGNAVYYGFSYDPHICKAEEINAWDMKYERMSERQYPNKNETVAPPVIKPIREVSPTTEKKYRKPRLNKKNKPVETIVVSEFDRQAKMYLDSIKDADREDQFGRTFEDGYRPGAPLDIEERSGHDSYRKRRDANRWMHALKVDCPKCEKRKGVLCISMNKYQKDHVVKVAHDERIKFADETFGKLYEEK